MKKTVSKAKNTIKYVPTLCEGEGAQFSGYVEMRKPTQEEFFTHQGTIERNEEDKGFSYHKRLGEFSKKFVKSVSLKNTDGTEYNSIDDLMADVDTLDLIVDIACACYAGPTKKKQVEAFTAKHSAQSQNSSLESSDSSKENPASQMSEQKT
jgi:hypothetical protein